MDSDRSVHWPMLFVYPETMQMDAVEDSSEEHSLADHLDAMFAEDAPPLQWDSERAYTRGTIEAYYLSHAAKPLALEQLTEVWGSHWPDASLQAHLHMPSGVSVLSDALASCLCCNVSVADLR